MIQIDDHMFEKGWQRTTGPPTPIKHYGPGGVIAWMVAS